ncbi:hypothetical protein RB195_008265 [Necator americanus]|uniref:Secreted protein n=1 Tax=Necator americanus TaxID=51031 RepID=A0ABR1CP89_NECAM
MTWSASTYLAFDFLYGLRRTKKLRRSAAKEHLHILPRAGSFCSHVTSCEIKLGRCVRVTSTPVQHLKKTVKTALETGRDNALTH